jgi:flagellar hook-associated protein 2
VSSGITFSGFNSIDFNVVVNALMTQASQPLTALQTKQTALKSQLSTFDTLASKVAAVQSAADNLSSISDISGFAATLSDSTALTASAGAGAAAGHYDIVINELARAQVTASATSSADADTTAVADGGTITINGKPVTITGPVTMVGLAKAINATSDIGVSASVVQTGAGAYRLVLTGTSTGAANGFTIENALTGGSGVGFTDTDGDGLAGNSTADNAVQATDASLLVNNLAITSASNTVTSAVPGTTLTLLKKSPGTVVSLDVSADSSGLQTKLEAFVAAYNALQKFSSDQTVAAAGGSASSIARDPLLRSLRASLRSTLSSQYGTGDVSYLSQLGVEFTRTGTLQFNATRFQAATVNGIGAVSDVLVGSGSQTGAFGAVSTLMAEYTTASGMIPQARTRLNNQISSIDGQIDDMQRRLDLQRAALIREYTAADVAMSQLKNQSGALSSFANSSSSSSSPTSNT